MSKIDWSKAPKDATHHVTSGVINQFMKDVTNATYKFWDKGEWVGGFNRTLVRHATPRPAAVETDLTKLDTPFGELDRATQLRLVEHVLDGGRVEKYQYGGWSSSATGYGNKLLCFVNGEKYRAIPKVYKYEPTERELEIAELYNKLHDIEAEIVELT